MRTFEEHLTEAQYRCDCQRRACWKRRVDRRLTREERRAKSRRILGTTTGILLLLLLLFLFVAVTVMTTHTSGDSEPAASDAGPIAVQILPDPACGYSLQT